MNQYMKPMVFRLGEAVLLAAGGVTDPNHNEFDSNGKVKYFHQAT
jgi:hypothetical protein